MTVALHVVHDAELVENYSEDNFRYDMERVREWALAVADAEQSLRKVRDGETTAEIAARLDRGHKSDHWRSDTKARTVAAFYRWMTEHDIVPRNLKLITIQHMIAAVPVLRRLEKSRTSELLSIHPVVELVPLLGSRFANDFPDVDQQQAVEEVWRQAFDDANAGRHPSSPERFPDTKKVRDAVKNYRDQLAAARDRKTAALGHDAIRERAEADLRRLGREFAAIEARAPEVARAWLAQTYNNYRSIRMVAK